MNITGEKIKIYTKEFNGKMYYRARLSKKNQKGEYENAYIDVKLPKDMALQDKSEIEITKGFLSFYKNKEGKDVFYIVIQEIKQKQDEVTVVENVTTQDLDEGMELPF